MSDLTFETRSNDWPDLDEMVTAGLLANAEETGAPPRECVPLVVSVSRRGKNMGGLVGKTLWGWLSVDRIWVAPALRAHGIGRKLMRFAEEEAKRRGCKHVLVDTMSFQVQGFYEKLGYEMWGTLDDFPEGHQRIFFQKRNI